MARWHYLVRAPAFPTRREAEEYGRVVHGEQLLEVISVADEEVAQEERRARRRPQLGDDEDGA